MKIFKIIVFLSMFSLISISYSSNITFNNTATVIDTTVNQDQNIKSIYNPINNTWIISYKNSSGSYGINEFNTKWENIYSVFPNCKWDAPPSTCTNGFDMARYTDYSLYGTVNILYSIYYVGGGSTSRGISGTYWMHNRSLSQNLGETTGFNIYNLNMSVDSDRFLVYTRNPGSLAFLLYDQDQDLNSDGELNTELPSSYRNPKSFMILMCGGRKHLIGLNSDNVIRDFLFNNETLSYIATFSLSYDYSIFQNDTNTIYQKSYGAYCDEDNDILYITFLNSNKDIFVIRALQLNSDTLTEVFTDELNISSIESSNGYDTGINNYIAKNPFLTQDDNGFFYLFYQFNNATNSYIKVLHEEKSCLCSGWINDICVGNHMRQVRTCVPSTCASKYQFIENNACAIQQNRTQGIFTQYFYDTSGGNSCDTGWKDPKVNGIIECSASVTIPRNCTSIYTNASARILTQENDAVGFTFKDNFTSYVCNPTNECTINNQYYCQDAYSDNITISKNNESYIAGDTAIATFRVIGQTCASQIKGWAFSEGWIKYRILGGITYTCSVPCGGWVCDTQGLAEYKVYQELDCTYNETSRTQCSMGCSNGKCLDTIGNEDTNKISQPIGNPFEWIKGEFENLMPTWMLSGFSFMSIIGIIAYFSNFIKDFRVLTMIGMMILGLFMIIGWIPPIIGIMIILVIGIIYARELFIK